MSTAVYLGNSGRRHGGGPCLFLFVPDGRNRYDRSGIAAVEPGGAAGNAH